MIRKLLEIGGRRVPFLRWSAIRRRRRRGPGDRRICYQRSIMMNVGDEKGALLDAAVRRASPRMVLELGTYCGYRALRMAQVLPVGGRVVSVEFSPANAPIARRILAHAGVADRVTVVDGHLGDGGDTAATLEAEHGFTEGSVDLIWSTRR